MPTLNLGRVRFNWRGEYNAATAYLEHDVVTADGQSYVCIADVTGTGPLDLNGSTYWEGALLRGADYNQARDDAVQAASNAEGSATSANNSAIAASGSATDASNAQTAAETARDKSQDWAEQPEDIEVEPGAYSAKHWASKAQSFGDPNEFNVTADLTSDTRKLREWMAQALANQQAATDALARSNHTGTQPLSTISDAGTAASRDVTTSATDTTAGRLMKVGDFGFGGFAAGSVAFADTLLPAGIYTPVNPADWFGGGAVNGCLLHMRRGSSGGEAQVFVREGISSYRLGYRTRTADTWNPAVAVFDQNNVVGPVSQSGGVPTGALFQRVLNASGQYTKHPDGTVRGFISTGEIADWTVAADYIFPLPLAVSNPDYIAYSGSIKAGSGGSAGINSFAFTVRGDSQGAVVRIDGSGTNGGNVVSREIVIEFAGYWY